MEATTTFNDMQVHMLQMFSVNRSKRGLTELYQVLYEHYAKRMNDRLNELWDNGVLDQQRLDEINSMPLFLQNKLLRVLQEKRFTRVGGHRSIEMTCRILCATNQRPQRLIESGQLREDLYFRLSAITLSIPPLKARKGDIPYLVDHFMRKINEENQTEISAIDPACRTYFDRYDWPGNVRELEHVIEYMMNITTEEKCLSLYDLPPYLLENAKKEISFNEREDFDGKTLREIMDSYERRVLSEVLRAHGYNVARCARELGIRRETLYYRLRRLGIEPRP